MLKIDHRIDKHRLRGATEVRFPSTRSSMLIVPDIGFPRSFLCSLLYPNTQQQTLVSVCHLGFVARSFLKRYAGFWNDSLEQI